MNCGGALSLVKKADHSGSSQTSQEHHYTDKRETFLLIRDSFRRSEGIVLKVLSTHSHATANVYDFSSMDTKENVYKCSSCSIPYMNVYKYLCCRI